MSQAVCELPPVFVLGDLLGEGRAARAWQSLLPHLHEAGLEIEARRFWPTDPGPELGRALPLVAGARRFSVRTNVSDEFLHIVEAATRRRAPLGSLLLTMDASLAVHHKALVPEAGQLRLLRVEDVEADPRAYAARLVDEVVAKNREAHGTFDVFDPKGSQVQREVVLTAPVLGPSGYAAEGRELFAAFERDPSVRLCLRPLRFGALDCREDADFLAAVREASLRQPSGSYDAIHLVFPRQFRPDPAARRNILRTMYETDAVPESWIEALQAADEIWVPSAFHVRSFGRVYPRERIRVVPEFVSADFTTTTPRRRAGPTRFLSVFDWSLRKAPELLLSCFGSTFRRGEAELALLVSSSSGVPREALEARAREDLERAARSVGHNPPQLLWLEPGLSPSDMPAVYAAMDAFVLCSHGEGWGRPLHEAMASGLPVIATAFGGSADLLGGTAVGHRIDGRLVPVPDHAILENPALGPTRDRMGCRVVQRWFEPCPESLARALRAVHEDEDAARAMGLRARQHVQRDFSRLRVPSERRSLQRRRCISFEGPLLGTSSYARITRRLAAALLRRGDFEVEARETTASPLPLAKRGDFDGSLPPALAARVVAGDPLTRERPELCLRSGWPLSSATPYADRWIQRFDWEYGALPRSAVSILDHGPDEIWVHSSVVRDSVVAAGIDGDRVFVIPHGIDPAIEHSGAPQLRALRERIDGRFAFLFVGSTIPRKGFDRLIEAWRMAFDAKDAVCLVIKSADGADAYAGQGIGKDILRELRDDPAVAEVIDAGACLGSDLGDDSMASLYTSCDCLVQPFRGEGFGLPLLEARACGLPIVLTAGGAPDDFLGEAGCLRVAATRKPLRLQEPCVGKPWLLEPSLDALVAALRAAWRDHGRLAMEARQDAVRVHEAFSWDAIAQRVALRLG